jgi:branched-chain amino acid transport system permease protein
VPAATHLFSWSRLGKRSTCAETESLMGSFYQLLVNGLIAGGAYALAAIGYAMVYSVLKFVNMANGAIAMIGGYLTFVLFARLGWPLAIALPVSMILTGLLGVAIDKIAYKPLRSAPKIISLITAMACSFILEAVVLLVAGAEWKRFPLEVKTGISIGPVFITQVQAGMLGLTVFFLVALYAFLNFTSLGRNIRAVADNPGLASINGIATENIISVVFFVGSALAAVAGTLIGLDTILSPSMGFNITMVGWAACVLGGMGYVEGAIVGGFVMGLAQNLGVWYLLGGDTRWKMAMAYVVMMVILVVKPAGLLGHKEDAVVFG